MRRAALALMLAGLLLPAACDEAGPAERAGREVGQSLDRAGERVRDTVDPPRGPAERIGRQLDRAVD
jgi:hypothetical protein